MFEHHPRMLHADFEDIAEVDLDKELQDVQSHMYSEKGGNYVPSHAEKRALKEVYDKFMKYVRSTRPAELRSFLNLVESITAG